MPKNAEMPEISGNAQKQGLLGGSSAGAYRTIASQIEGTDHIEDDFNGNARFIVGGVKGFIARYARPFHCRRR
jgi:hypothetical protein